MYIYIYVQPNMVNLLAITFCYFSDEHLTKLDGGRGLAPVDGHCSNKRLKAGCFFHLGPVGPDPKGLSMFIIIGTKPKYGGQSVYQCLSFINVWLVTEHTNKTAVRIVDVYCSHFWTKPCGSTKLKRGSWKNDVIQKNHRFLMTRPWHLCSSLEVPVRWQWGAPL